MSDQPITECSCSASINVSIEEIDIPTWLFTLPDAEYQRCSPAHIAAATTVSDDGRRMSINVETIGGSLMVQHYVEDIAQKDHCRLFSTSEVKMPTGWTKLRVFWEMTVKAIDKNSCELINHVGVSSTPEFLHDMGRSGIPIEAVKQLFEAPTAAHNAQETPGFAASMERKALAEKKTFL